MKMNLRPWKHSQPKAAYESNKEQDKYISLVNSIRGFSAIVDRDGMLQFATEDPLQKFGYQKDEMIGKPFWDASWFALSSESRRIMENGVLDALEGENVSCTVQTFAKDGTSLPVTFNIRPVPAEGEDIISIVTDVQDVNEHKQGFGTKKSSLASLHPIIDITNGTHYQTDKDGNLTSIGAPAITLLGYNSPDELIGRNITLFWDNPEEEILFLSQLNTHKKVQGFRTTFKKPDGTLVAVEIDSQQILDVDGQVLGNKGSFRDADIIQGTVDIEMPSSDTTVIGPTEAMPVSEALLEDQRSEEVLSTLLLESAADGIAVVEHGTITMANHKLGMMLGCNRIDLVDTSFNDLLSPDSRRVMAERHERRVAGEDVPDLCQLTMLRKDGGSLDVEASTAIATYHGTPVDLVVLRNNVEERKRTNDQLHSRDVILESVALVSQQLLAQRGFAMNVRRSLALLGDAVDVDRVYIFQNRTSDDGTVASSLYCEWTASGISSHIDDPNSQNIFLEASGYERWAREMRQGNSVFGQARYLPYPECQLLESRGVNSLVVSPVFTDRGWWGFIGFDDCTQERLWSTPEIEALKLVANTIGAALQREYTERVVKESEDKYSAIVENSTDGIVIVQNLKCVFANHRIADLTGYTIEEIDQMPINSIIAASSPNSIDIIMKKYGRRAIADQMPLVYDVDILRKDGGILPVEVSSTSIDHDGRPAALISVRDVSARRRMENRLSESEQVLQDLMVRLEASQQQLQLPIIQVWDQILALPVVGTIDSARSQQITDTLLDKIAATKAQYVILDISGINHIDEDVANNIVRTVRAAGLLGAECVVTGLKPESAQAISGLSASDLNAFAARRDMQQGLKWGLNKLGYTEFGETFL